MRSPFLVLPAPRALTLPAVAVIRFLISLEHFPMSPTHILVSIPRRRASPRGEMAASGAPAFWQNEIPLKKHGNSSTSGQSPGRPEKVAGDFAESERRGPAEARAGAGLGASRRHRCRRPGGTLRDRLGIERHMVVRKNSPLIIRWRQGRNIDQRGGMNILERPDAIRHVGYKIILERNGPTSPGGEPGYA